MAAEAGSPAAGGAVSPSKFLVLAERPDYEKMVDSIAEAAHEANRAYCASIGDDSQKPWAQAEQWQRDSSAAGVLFLMANPDAGESAQHENWVKDKIRDGWVYGEVKDAELKTHPCIVDFAELPPEQQEKDRIFRRTVLAKLEEALDRPVDRGPCPKIALVAKYGDRVPVTLRDWHHWDRLVADHGAENVTREGS